MDLTHRNQIIQVLLKLSRDTQGPPGGPQGPLGVPGNEFEKPCYRPYIPLNSGSYNETKIPIDVQ